ncbi:hypothetical protein [Moorena sp. SIO3H5]|uniref:hypothetical protein n=1 Tax=Moorena sp. SIO3H5 TaxID=2607834 RepID=UPI0013B5F7CC|nr:hypothetical protein [Moorena sp. SIO3H5]NEO71006.1 hypothetical protein [Moorena sp. SIO3H5]
MGSKGGEGKRQEARGKRQLAIGCGTGILPVSWLWSGGQDAHSTDIDQAVELASSCRTGIKLWNWHLASVMVMVARASSCRTGILPVSWLWSRGQDAHSTDIETGSRTGILPVSIYFL